MNYLIKPLLAIALAISLLSVLAFTLIPAQLPSKDEPTGAEYKPVTSLPYNISRPMAINELPNDLLEISGLTDLDNNTLACVQDEDGIIFIYDLKKEKVVREIKFGDDGDYEGITRAGNSLYVLRSDGKIYEIDDYRTDNFKVKSYDNDLPVKNSEGLGLDAAGNRLLIAGKTEAKDGNYEGKKVVYGFDLSTKRVSAKPVLSFSEDAIIYAMEREGGKNIGKKGKDDVSINPSAIAIHPQTDQIYVLSSKDHLLYIFNRANEVEGIYLLNKQDFAQPEGITFLENGDMFISNEGKKGAPTLLRFAYSSSK